jgi:hypothetical protein
MTLNIILCNVNDEWQLQMLSTNAISVYVVQNNVECLIQNISRGSVTLDDEDDHVANEKSRDKTNDKH